MTFNKMRFPIVWITFATLCVVLCSLEVHCGPVGSKLDLVDHKDQVPAPTDFVRSARQAEDGSDESGDEDSEEDDDGGDESDDDDDEGRSFRHRSVREVATKPVVELETDEETVIPTVETPAVPEKKPSVLELLSSALDKAIEATQKIPTQQVATDAAGVFQILGQVFTEAIDKVIGDDDGSEENATALPVIEGSDDKAPTVESVIVPAPAPVNEEPMKMEEHQVEASQSESK